MRWSALVVLLCARAASAYDSQCTTPPNFRSGGSFEAGACTLPGTKSPDNCVGPLAGARGGQLGEHTVVTRWAMEKAGFSRAFIDDSTVFDYYTRDQILPGNLTTLEPTSPGAMGVHVDSRARPFTVAEFAQLPDWSYAMPDFVMGNEFCPAPNEARATLADAVECHGFEQHMGAVNSTHFSPQNKAVYELYHGIALALAARCKKSVEALAPTDAGPHPLQEKFEKFGAECEKEALAFESIGTHYLADAWSSGHMWERWGLPILPAGGDAEKLAPRVVALVAGMIHGAFSVAAAKVPLWAADDQLCLPGPSEWTFPNGQVEWAYPGAEDTRWAGAGDNYLRKCDRSNWDLETRPELLFQRRRMFTCLALGLREVYEAGPQISSGRPLPAVVDADPQVSSSTDPLCWSQRATNDSMWLGTGLSALPTSRDPLFWTNVVLVIGGKVGLSTEQVSNRLRHDLVRIQFDMSWDALDRPHETTSARLQSDALGTLLGVARNSASVPMIADGGVSYLERRDPTAWVASNKERCTTHADCPLGSYCGAAQSPTAGRRCTTHEGAVMNAFRQAELPAWCVQDDLEALGFASAACKAAGGQGPACESCMRVALPHLRNACDEGSYSPKLRPITSESRDAGLLDHRSICDLLRDGDAFTAQPTPLYLRYDPQVKGAAERAAWQFCVEGGKPEDRLLSYDFLEDPPLAFEDFHAAQVSRAYNTCGSGLGTHWRRFRHGASGAPHEHTLQVIPLETIVNTADGGFHKAELDELDLRLYEGPDCTRVLAQGKPIDSDGDQVDDLLAVTWRPAATASSEVCLRVKATSPMTWSGYLLRSEDDLGGSISTGVYHTCAHKRGGTVECAGENAFGQLGRGYYSLTGPSGVPTPGTVISGGGVALAGVVQMAEGSFSLHNCARRGDGTVWCWGANTVGELGIGGTTYAPFPADRSNVAVQVPGLSGVADVSNGGESTCALVADGGTVMCWGDWAPAAGGGYRTSTRPRPVLKADGRPLRDVVQLAAGNSHACGLTANAQVWCWGDNFRGQLGQGYRSSLVPNPDGGIWLVCTPGPGCPPPIDFPIEVQVGSSSVVPVRLSAGDGTCALLSDGTVSCWPTAIPDGGLTFADGGSVFRPRQVPVLRDVTAISVGGDIPGGVTVGGSKDVRCAVTGGYVWCWGSNALGQLGTAVPKSPAFHPDPVPILGLPPDIKHVSASLTYACASTKTCSVWCWGENWWTQFGDGTNRDSAKPVLSLLSCQ